MDQIFDTCEPRDDVLTGGLREEIFAAHLRDVIDEKADPVYRDPAVFFEHTYPTEGIRTLLREALGRLSGAKKTTAPIIRLETSFGGGKTHSLIALYHAARGGKQLKKYTPRFVDTAFLPGEPIAKIAGVVGSDIDPVNGLDHGDVKTYTVWGEIAYQLGGKKGYDLIKKSDEGKVAPGAQIFEKLVGDEPALIMLDEFAAFLRKAQAVPVGDSTLAEQTPSFLLSLLSFAAKAEKVVVVITLADSKDAFAQETEKVQEALVEAGKISARQEAIITPTGEAEIAPIVAHRLFAKVDRKVAPTIAQAYHDYFEKELARGAELPEHAGRAEYKEEIEKNYPFSPELISTLNRKTSTIPDFQRTRGALRLLALVVRRLWEKKPRDTYLIHPHHVDLGVTDVVEELTSRLKRPQFRQVVEADIVAPQKGSPSHAEAVDDPLVKAGKPPYAERFATAIFLHSIVQGTAAGANIREALLGVLTPADEPSLVQKAADDLYNCAWFLDYDGQKYRFKTEPSLNKLIADEMEIVGRSKPKEELDRRIQNVWRKGLFKPVYFPAEAGAVDDDAQQPKLVIIHYDAATVKATEEAPPEIVVRIFDHAGSKEGYRTYKNNVVFVVADSDQIERMVDIARRHYAIKRIFDDPARMKEFEDEQRKKLKGMLEEADLQYRVAITKAYRFLFYPSADAPEKYGKLAREILPPQDQGSIEQDQTQVVLRVLRQVDKARVADDNPLAAAFVKAKAWPAGKEYATTAEIARAFTQRLHLYILFDPNQLKKTIRDGCALGTWYYQHPGDKELYGPPSPPPPVELSDDAMLFTPDEAKRIGYPVKGEKTAPEFCPVCHNPVDQCTCGTITEPATAKAIRGDGPPAQAFQAVLDQAHDRKVKRIKRLLVKVDGRGKEVAADARLLGLAIPQLGKADITIEQRITCELGDDTLQLTFKGSWDRYKAVKTLTDAFGNQADAVICTTELRAGFPEGLDLNGDQFQTIRDVFTTLGFTRLAVEAEPADEVKP